MSLLSAAYVGLLILTAATPVLLFFNNLFVAGTIELYAAIGMFVVAIGIPSSEARHAFKLVRIPAVLATIPLLWVLAQLLPVQGSGLSRSIWESSAGALETSRLSASITIDPGLTLMAACRFATMACIAFVAAIISIDRQRAERLLWLLVGATATISVIFSLCQIAGFHFKDEPGTSSTYATMTTASIIGIVVFTASVIMAVEKFEQRHGLRKLLSQGIIPIGVTIAGLVIFCTSLIAADTGQDAFAAICGLATIAVIYATRRMGFGPKAGLAVGCLAIIAVAMIVWPKGDHTIADPSLRYAAAADGQATALDKRMADAVGPAGSGAGTFSAASTIYGAQTFSNASPTTFAAKISVELGRPALWVFVGLVCLQILLFARGSFNRGRDCFYTLAGAGVAVAMFVDCFTSATLTNCTISVLVALTFGLGLGQSVSRSH